jgi:hypothetical protein
LACRGLIVSMSAAGGGRDGGETMAETMAETVAETVAETGVAETALCIVPIYLVIYRVYRGGSLVGGSARGACRQCRRW